MQQPNEDTDPMSLNNGITNTQNTPKLTPSSLSKKSSTPQNYNVTQNISLVNNVNNSSTMGSPIKPQDISSFSVGHSITATDIHFSQMHDAPFLLQTNQAPPSNTSMQHSDSHLIGHKRRQSFDNSNIPSRIIPSAYTQAYIPTTIPAPITPSIQTFPVLSAPLPTQLHQAQNTIPLEQANSLSLSRDFHQFVLNVHGIKNPEIIPSLPPLPNTSPPQPSSPLMQNNQNLAVTATPIELSEYGMPPFSVSPKPQAIRLTSPTMNIPKDFVCSWDQCTDSFATRTGLATHCSSHLHVYMEQQAKQESEDSQTGQKRTRMVFPCKWNNCIEVFTSLKALAKHLSLEDHVGQSPFLTKVESQQQIEYQYKTSPETKKKYLCSFPGCGKSFTDSSNRKKHERTHDANRERFHCTEPGCNRSYSTKTDLNIHLKVHKGEFPHKCTDPNCNKAFVRLSELYAHERTHDNILPHTCSVCGKSFREKSRLKRHEDLHAKQPNHNVNLISNTIQSTASPSVAAQSILRLSQSDLPPHTNEQNQF